MHLKCINTCIIKKYTVMALHFKFLFIIKFKAPTELLAYSIITRFLQQERKSKLVTFLCYHQCIIIRYIPVKNYLSFELQNLHFRSNKTTIIMLSCLVMYKPF